ncbi:MAG TPA: glycosyltransferase family 2 protein [Dehalococcoidia bacterium]|jgi:glycosyltransferase involved in cell wall biosynthesis
MPALGEPESLSQHRGLNGADSIELALRGTDHRYTNLRVAVLVPCFNEAKTIAAVVSGYRAALPSAAIYVYDNNSTDGTAEIARAAGAEVRVERLQGKGNVVRRMFADIDADVYVLVDGDSTYDPALAPRLIERLVTDRLDMAVGCRATQEAAAFRAGHRFGNRWLTRSIGLLFGQSFTDVLSGYRVLSRRFVKSFPAMSTGFEIETELTVHALKLRMPTAEIEGAYGARPSGSVSKLNTYGDGLRIWRTILRLFRDERPLAFFGIVCLVFAAMSIALGSAVVDGYLRTGVVRQFPTAILATGIMVLAVISLACGLILDSVAKGRRELKRLTYLSIPPVGD